MKIFIFNIPQTPTKPILPAWLRPLCQFDICYRLAKLQGHKIDGVRYVDDTGLQVAKLMVLKEKISLPPKCIGEYLGEKYIEANKLPRERAERLKLELEQNPFARPFLMANIKEQEKYFSLMGIKHFPVFWESDLIKKIPNLIKKLKKREEVLDYSYWQGNIYLDYSEKGMRPIVLKGKTGYTYLAKLLTFLENIKNNYELIILQRIDEDKHPFDYCEEYLKREKKRYFLLATGRVKIKGQARSSRYGGWQDFTIGRIYESFKDSNINDFRVALRLFFLEKKDMVRIEFDYKKLKEKIEQAKEIREFIKGLKTRKEDVRLKETKLLKIYHSLFEIRSLSKPSMWVKLYLALYWEAKRRIKAGKGFLGYVFLLKYLYNLLGGE